MFERVRSLLQRLTGGAVLARDERRVWDRLSSARETIIRSNVEGAAPLRARVQNASRGGARMLVGQPLDEGDMILVELPTLNGEPITSILACVVHVRPESSAWSVGCCFATELNDADLHSLGAKRAKADHDDQRAWERVPIQGVAVFTPARQARAEPQTAPIHNLSPTGVALRLSRRLEPGTLLSLELRTEIGQTSVTILGCVVYLSEVGTDRWLAGCNFIRELDDSELQKLT